MGVWASEAASPHSKRVKCLKTATWCDNRYQGMTGHFLSRTVVIWNLMIVHVANTDTRPSNLQAIGCVKSKSNKLYKN